MMKVKPLPSDPFKFYQEVERIGSHIPANIICYGILLNFFEIFQSKISMFVLKT